MGCSGTVIRTWGFYATGPLKQGWPSLVILLPQPPTSRTRSYHPPHPTLQCPPPFFGYSFYSVMHAKQGFYQLAVSPALECLKENWEWKWQCENNSFFVLWLSIYFILLRIQQMTVAQQCRLSCNPSVRTAACSRPTWATE